MDNKLIELNRKLEILKEREKEYLSLKQQLINAAKNIYGESIIDDYSIPENFNLHDLNSKETVIRIDQTVPVPYSNEDFTELLKMPKRAITNIFCEPHGRKFVQSMFLIGKASSGKYVLFSFSVVRDKKEKDNYTIKLDVKPQGKFWMPLARLDCATGMSHANLINEGKVASSQEEVKRIPTPHLHIYNELTQVLFFDELEYASATSMAHMLNLSKPLDDKENFMTVLNYMLKFCNVNVRTTTVDTSIYGNYLFNFEDVHCISTPKELGD